MSPPESFNADQKTAWNRAVAMLTGCGILQESDALVLEAYCTSYVRWQKTEHELRKIEKEKSFLASVLSRGAQSAIVINPLVTLNMKLKAETVGYAIQLGMTPQARMKMEGGSLGVAQKKVNLFQKLRESKDDQVV
jgi:P27 family predicted phage terminase small subunit